MKKIILSLSLLLSVVSAFAGDVTVVEYLRRQGILYANLLYRNSPILREQDLETEIKPKWEILHGVWGMTGNESSFKAPLFAPNLEVFKKSEILAAKLVSLGIDPTRLSFYSKRKLIYKAPVDNILEILKAGNLIGENATSIQEIPNENKKRATELVAVKFLNLANYKTVLQRVAQKPETPSEIEEHDIGFVKFLIAEGISEKQAKHILDVVRDNPRMGYFYDYEKGSERIQWLKNAGIVNIGGFIARMPLVLNFQIETNLKPTWDILRNAWGLTVQDIESQPRLLTASADRLLEIQKVADENGISLKDIPERKKKTLITETKAARFLEVIGKFSQKPATPQEPEIEPEVSVPAPLEQEVFAPARVYSVPNPNLAVQDQVVELLMEEGVASKIIRQLEKMWIDGDLQAPEYAEVTRVLDTAHIGPKAQFSEDVFLVLSSKKYVAGKKSSSIRVKAAPKIVLASQPKSTPNPNLSVEDQVVELLIEEGVTPKVIRQLQRFWAVSEETRVPKYTEATEVLTEAKLASAPFDEVVLSLFTSERFKGQNTKNESTNAFELFLISTYGISNEEVQAYKGLGKSKPRLLSVAEDLLAVRFDVKSLPMKFKDLVIRENISIGDIFANLRKIGIVASRVHSIGDLNIAEREGLSYYLEHFPDIYIKISDPCKSAIEGSVVQDSGNDSGAVID